MIDEESKEKIDADNFQICFEPDEQFEIDLMRHIQSEEEEKRRAKKKNPGDNGS